MVEQVIIYPTKEEVTIEKREDGGYNLHNESGVTTWNVPETEVERLIAYQKTREQVEEMELRMEEDAAARRLAAELEAAWDAAIKHNNKLNKELSRAAHTPLTMPTVRVSLSAEVIIHNASDDHLIQVYIAAGNEEVDRAKALAEYSDWSGGEILPDDAIVVYESWRSTEWRLTVPYTEGMACHIPIIASGTTGRGYKAEAGLLKGTMVAFYGAKVEDFIRAGLRA